MTSIWILECGDAGEKLLDAKGWSLSEFLYWGGVGDDAAKSIATSVQALIKSERLRASFHRA